MGRPKSKSIWPRVLAVFLLPAALVTLSQVGPRLDEEDSHRGLIAGGAGVGPTNPIAGDLVTSAVAGERLTFSMPTLPDVIIETDCAPEVRVERIEIWVSPEGVPALSRQLGVVYSGGIWLTAESITRWSASIQKSGELPSVEQLDGGPGRLQDTSVRGHTAWVKEGGLDPCQALSRAIPQTSGSPQPGLPPGDSTELIPAILYDPTRTASIRWIERGLVIEVGGPLTVSALTELASGVLWQ